MQRNWLCSQKIIVRNRTIGIKLQQKVSNLKIRRDKEPAAPAPTITSETECSETSCLSKREAKPPNFIS